MRIPRWASKLILLIPAVPVLVSGAGAASGFPQDAMVVSAVAASPSSSPRVVLSVAKGTRGTITVKVENVSGEPMALAARTYLALSRATAEGAQEPLYWAEVNSPRLPQPSTPLRLAGKQKVEVPLDLRSVLWSPDRSGMTAGHTLARGVPPGEYELQLQMTDERGASWRSGGLTLKVSPGGGLTF
jgi:hypothetical protein